MTIVKLDPLPARGKRRTFLSGFTLSATAIALLAGKEQLGLVGTASAQTANNDVAILNGKTAVDAEVTLHIDNQKDVVAHHFLGRDRHVCSLP